MVALKKITRAAKDKKENDTSVELLRIEVARPLEHLGPMEGEASQSVFMGPGQQFYVARTLMPGMKAAALLWGRWMALIARLRQGMFEEEELVVVVLPKKVILVMQGDQVRRDQMAALVLTSLTALGLNIQWGRGKRGRDILVDGASLTKTQLGGEVVQLAWPTQKFVQFQELLEAQDQAPEVVEVMGQHLFEIGRELHRRYPSSREMYLLMGCVWLRWSELEERERKEARALKEDWGLLKAKVVQGMVESEHRFATEARQLGCDAGEGESSALSGRVQGDSCAADGHKAGSSAGDAHQSIRVGQAGLAAKARGRMELEGVAGLAHNAEALACGPAAGCPDLLDPEGAVPGLVEDGHGPERSHGLVPAAGVAGTAGSPEPRRLQSGGGHNR